MRSTEDKGCLSPTPPHEISSNNAINFEFHKANGKSRSSQHRMALGKPTPSKWDDAQKWLVNLRGGDKSQSKSEPRNSNADDRRLITAVPKKEDYSSGEDEERNVYTFGSSNTAQCDVETKKVECDDSLWRINKHGRSASVVQSICVRDMGTDTTPIASQGPSRAATPIRAMTPAAQGPMSSGSSTPVRSQNGVQALDSCQMSASLTENREDASGNSITATRFSRDREVPIANMLPEKSNSDHQVKKLNPLVTRAMCHASPILGSTLSHVKDRDRNTWLVGARRLAAECSNARVGQMSAPTQDNRVVRTLEGSERIRGGSDARQGAVARIKEHLRGDEQIATSALRLRTVGKLHGMV